MAKKPTVTTVSSGYYGRTALNDNFTALRDAFDNTVSRDGSTPNSMSSDLDMNSNDVNNVGNISASTLVVNGTQLTASNAVAGVTEGTWTPRANNTADTASTSQTSQWGKYVRVGNMVTVWFGVETITKGDLANGDVFAVHDLPFSAAATPNNNSFLGTYIWNNITGVTDATVEVFPTTDYLIFRKTGLNTTADRVDGADLSTSNVTVEGTISYVTDV